MPSVSTRTRGDTVNVVNSSFLGTPAVDEGELESIPFWERAWAQTLAKVLAGLLVLLVIVFSVLKPLTKGLLTAARPSVLRQAALGRHGWRSAGGSARARLRTTSGRGARHGRAGSEARSAGRESLGGERCLKQPKAAAASNAPPSCC